MAKEKNRYVRIKKTKEMAQVFKRKSGPINKKKSRKTEKQEIERSISRNWDNSVKHGIGTDHFTNAAGASHRYR